MSENDKQDTSKTEPVVEKEATAITWGMWARLVALIIVVVSVLIGAVGGMPLALIFLAASALCGAIALLWSSLQLASREEAMDLEEALHLAAPIAAEEQKLAVLRALKDLEYELSLGKITKADFDQANAEYRAEARRLIAQQDEQMKVQLEAATARAQQHIKTKKAASREASATSTDSAEEKNS